MPSVKRPTSNLVMFFSPGTSTKTLYLELRVLVMFSLVTWILFDQNSRAAQDSGLV